MAIVRCFQDSGGHTTDLVYRYCKLFARVMMAYSGSPDLVGPWKRGTDTTAHARLIKNQARDCGYWAWLHSFQRGSGCDSTKNFSAATQRAKGKTEARWRDHNALGPDS
jgi:hypothetical protein